MHSLPISFGSFLDEVGSSFGPSNLKYPETIEDFKIAYNELISTEKSLRQHLQTTKTELEEKTIYFEEAVQLGEHLDQLVKDLSARLDDTLDENSGLRMDNKMLNGKIDILLETIGEAQVAEQKAQTTLVEVRKSKITVEEDLWRSKQIQEVAKNYRKSYPPESVLTSDVRKLNAALKETKLALDKETALRFEIEDKHASLEKRLADITKHCKELEWKCRTAKQNEAKYQNILMNSTTEHAKLENEYDDLLKYLSNLEEELLKAKIEIESNEQSRWENALPLNNTIIIDTEIGHDSVTNSSLKNICSINALLSGKPSLRKSLKDEYTQQGCKNERNERVIQEYMHITATAVKLHFPNIDIRSAELIDKVKSAPFYLFYDHMMQFMQSKKNETRPALVALEDSGSFSSDLKKPSNSLTRFFQLKKRANVNLKDSPLVKKKASMIKSRGSMITFFR